MSDYPTEAVLLLNSNKDELDKHTDALASRQDASERTLCVIQQPDGFVKFNEVYRSVLVTAALARRELVWAGRLEQRPLSHQVQVLVILKDGRACVVYQARRG